jgi:hypothetical protein
VNNVDILFPFEPYSAQISFMERVVTTLQTPNTNALLESPTGTGKTLCLLCSSLAWRQTYSACSQAFRLTSVSSDADSLRKQLSEAAHGKMSLGSTFTQPSAMSFGSSEAVRVIYLSRTHGQLSQVIRELRSTAYRPRISVLGSRQQLCVHPEVSKLRGAAQNCACQKLVSAKACPYHMRVMEHKYDKDLSGSLLDIEDLCKHGQQQKVCPYYLSRELANEAEVIFMPYNYLTDTASRRSLGTLWHNSVAIFDEAHNLESILSESSSFDLRASNLALAIAEVDRTEMLLKNDPSRYTAEGLSDPPTEIELRILKALLLKLESVIRELPLAGDPPSLTRSGEFIFEIFAAADIHQGNVDELLKMIDRTSSVLSEGASSSASPALRSVGEALEMVFRGSGAPAPGQPRKPAHNTALYKVYVSEDAGGPRPSDARVNIAAISAAPQAGGKGRSVGYWCFSAGGCQHLRRHVAAAVRRLRRWSAAVFKRGASRRGDDGGDHVGRHSKRDPRERNAVAALLVVGYAFSPRGPSTAPSTPILHLHVMCARAFRARGAKGGACVWVGWGQWSWGSPSRCSSRTRTSSPSPRSACAPRRGGG